jgi:hypothetical protein
LITNEDDLITTPNEVTIDPIYQSWMHLIDVCCNPSNPEYKYFGAIGVKVCDEWLNSYSNFLQDMSPTPEQTNEKFFIERIDITQPYCKSNCKWTMLKLQKELSFKKHKPTPLKIDPLNLEDPTPADVGRLNLEDPSTCQLISARRNALCPSP